MTHPVTEIAVVTPISKNPYSVVNGLLHVFREAGCPGRVSLLYMKDRWVAATLNAIESSFRNLCPHTSFSRRRLHGGLRSDIGQFKAEVEALKGEGYRVYVNITPGTKLMTLAAYLGAVEAGADEIFYLSVEDRSYTETLLPFIPRSLVASYTVPGGR